MRQSSVMEIAAQALHAHTRTPQHERTTSETPRHNIFLLICKQEAILNSYLSRSIPVDDRLFLKCLLSKW
jgi:hypothetical protein